MCTAGERTASGGATNAGAYESVKEERASIGLGVGTNGVVKTKTKRPKRMQTMFRLPQTKLRRRPLHLHCTDTRENTTYSGHYQVT